MAAAKKSKNKSNTSSSSPPKSSSNTKLPDTMGLPPSTGSGITYTDAVRKNSSLLINISPCSSNFEAGLSLFTFSPAWDAYVKQLSQFNFSPGPNSNSRRSLQFAVQADSPHTDSFTNDYGESMFNKLTDVAASGFGELAQMSNSKTATGTIQKLGESMKSSNHEFIKKVGEGAEKAGKSLEDLKGQTGALKGFADVADKLLAGARIDFPMIWKNSSYHTSYSFTIRLYNPSPASDLMTEKYIIGPLAALLTLALPQSDSTNTYKWPFFCKINSPGYFKVMAGGITNISVTKGGDHNLIAWNQRMAEVDVRIDFINIHNVMLLSNGTGRPTLKEYLDNLRDKTSLEDIYRDGDYITDAELDKTMDKKAIEKAQAASAKEYAMSQRASEDQKAKEAALRSNSPSGLYMEGMG